MSIVTKEGVACYEEAIALLEQMKPMGPLQHNESLAKAAQDHVKDKGMKGLTGHEGSDRSKACDRMNRYGLPTGLTSENLSYWRSTGLEIVVQLCVDDGVPERSHRCVLLNPDLNLCGVATGPHKTMRTITVIDYSQGMEAKGAVDPAQKQMDDFAKEVVEWKDMPEKHKGFKT